MWTLLFILDPLWWVLAHTGILGQGAKKEAEKIAKEWQASFPLLLLLAFIAGVAYAVIRILGID